MKNVTVCLISTNLKGVDDGKEKDEDLSQSSLISCESEQDENMTDGVQEAQESKRRKRSLDNAIGIGVS
jgi:hypothetical protein